jgi:ankyrin repeat protein
MALFGLFEPPNVEKLKAKKDVKGLIKALSYQKDYRVRKDAVKDLGQIGDARAVESLIVALKDGNIDVRKAAAGALGDIGDARALKSLITALQDDDVCNAAAIALGKIGDVNAVEPLIAALKNKSSQDAASAALDKLGDSRALQNLIKIRTLHDAVISGDLVRVWAHLKCGADINVRVNGVTPLHVAAGLGQYSPGKKGLAPPRCAEIAKLLVEHGADVRARGDNLGIDRTALHGFAENGNAEMVAYLIKHNADVNATDMDGRTPLHLAARWGYVEVAKVLIDGGANVNAKVLDGSTPLRLATLNQHAIVSELFRQHGGC